MSKRKISVGDKIYAVHLYLDGVSVGRFSPFRGCGRNPGPNEVINRRRSRTCIPTKTG